MLPKHETVSSVSLSINFSVCQICLNYQFSKGYPNIRKKNKIHVGKMLKDLQALFNNP